MEVIARHNLKKIEKYFLILKSDVKTIYTYTEKKYDFICLMQKKKLQWNHNKVYSHRAH